MDLLFIFEWLDTSILADISKAYGGVFAVGEAVAVAVFVRLVTAFEHLPVVVGP